MKLKDVKQLVAAGLISPEQGEAITAHFHLDESRVARWIFFILGSLAAAHIVGGLILLVSANWQSIPDIVKMGSAMTILAGFWFAYAKLRNSMPIVAECLSFAGGGMWLANIALYGQIFQLQNPFVEGCALFFAGIALLPFLSCQRILYAGVVATSIILFIAMVEVPASESFLALPIDNDNCLLGVILLLTFWWLIGERFRKLNNAFRFYSWTVPFLVFTLLCIVQAILCYSARRWFDADWVTVLFCCLTGIVMAALKPKAAKWLPWATFAAGMTVSLLAGLAREVTIAFGEGVGIDFQIPRAVTILLCAGLAVLLGWNGWAARRIAWINYGVLLFFFAGFSIFVNVLGSLTASGFTLILGGGLLLGLVIILEKQRRRLITGMRALQED